MSTAGAVAVLGAGSWGTALAIQLARSGVETRLWGRDWQAIEALRSTRRNARYLPDQIFPELLHPEPDLGRALKNPRAIVLAVPSVAFASVLDEAARRAPAAGIIWATKGLDPSSARLLHTLADERLAPGTPCAVLSGPTFAGEVAAGLPAAVTLASRREDFATLGAELLHGGRFRVYTSDDVVGVEVGGALKNIFAIGAGIADGLGFGANTRAALIARGLQEMMRFGALLGARRETLMGLAGLGDLVLTCTDDQSRNRRFGLAIAQGLDVGAALARVGQTVEGAQTVRQVWRVAAAGALDMPITAEVHAILWAGKAPLAAVNALLARPPGTEN